MNETDPMETRISQSKQSDISEEGPVTDPQKVSPWTCSL
jgi:hypothetical protein